MSENTYSNPNKTTTYIVHTIIPARGGSKSLPMKNILSYKGLPLIAHSIKQSLSCPLITKTVVTTDHLKIAEIAKEAGAEVPFIRPSKISQDLSTDYEFINHYLQHLKDTNQTLPDILLQLRPTYPNRTVSLITHTLQDFIKHYDTHTSLRTVIPIEKSAFKMYTLSPDATSLTPIVTYHPHHPTLTEPYNRCRQELPQTYLHNGCIDIVKTTTITEQHSVTGKNILPYIMNPTDNHDIDTQADLERSEKAT